MNDMNVSCVCVYMCMEMNVDCSCGFLLCVFFIYKMEWVHFRVECCVFKKKKRERKRKQTNEMNENIVKFENVIYKEKQN